MEALRLEKEVPIHVNVEAEFDTESSISRKKAVGKEKVVEAQEVIAFSSKMIKQHTKELNMGTSNPLVNIPIQEEGFREVLKEIGPKKRNEAVMGSTNKGGRRWRRAAGKENKEGVDAMSEDGLLIASTKRP